MAVISWMSLVFMMLVGTVGIPLPIGVPPLPEDPALLRAAAPESALAYVQWAGIARPDPKSTNLTERLAAEPEVRMLFEQLVRATRVAFRQNMRGREYAQAERSLRLALEVFERPGCLFLSELDVRQSRVRCGLVVNMGDRGERILGLVRSLSAALFGSEPTKLEENNAEQLPIPAGGPPVSYVVVGEHLVLGVGAGTTNRIVSRLRGNEGGLGGHPTFVKLHDTVRVEQPSSRTYVDTAALLELFGPMPGSISNVLQAFGLSHVRALLTESGLEGEGFVTRTIVATPARRGLLALFEGEPLRPAELATIPADAMLAVAARIDPAKAWDRLLEVVARIEPRARAELERVVAEDMDRHTGVRLAEDLLAHCGDTLTVWSSPQQGGLIFTGAVAALSLEDAEKFRAGFTKLMEVAKQGATPRRSPSGRLRRGVYLQETTLAGQTVWWVNTVGEDFPLAPAWTITDSHVLFSLFPQPLKSAIRRGVGPAASLATAEPTLLSPDTVALAFVNEQQLFDIAYPILQMLGQLACSEMQREGFVIDITSLPTAEALRPHLRTSAMQLERHEAGLRLIRRGTLPMADPLLGGVLPAVAGLFTYRTSVVRREGMMRQMEAARAAELQAARKAQEEARKAKEAAEAEKNKRGKKKD